MGAGLQFGAMGDADDADDEGSRNESPVLLVAVGTEPRPFPRLLTWIENWSADHPRWDLEVQHGVTPAPRAGHAVAYLGRNDMRRALHAAAVVVSDAEQATISQARAAGHVPVVVARDPDLGEHADDQQILLARRLGAAGLIWPAESEAGLCRAISAALAAAAASADDEPVAPRGASSAAERLVDDRSAQGMDRGPRAAGRRRAVRRGRRRR
jgi:UDP-N-acetylglucosamine transferase subunit ALG13